MSKILVSGGLVPTTKDTLLDARTRVATFSDIANIENPARFMAITVEDTGKKYEVRKLSSKIIGGIVVENSTIDINDPEALVDLGLAEELRSEDEKVRQSNEKKRIEAENLRKAAEDSRKVNETNRVSAEGVREDSERTRVTSEDTRNANEQTRNSNETKRQSQESTRQSQESARQNNESVRNTNESARKEAESERKTEETSRRTAELSRSTAENTRVKNEQNRTTAENTRSSAEDRRVTNETQRTTNETARNNAELSREQAEGNRASTFNTLKGQMQTTIQEGQAAVAATEKATSDAQKVVDNYDAKVAEQDGKLSELGSEARNNTNLVGGQVLDSHGIFEADYPSSTSMDYVYYRIPLLEKGKIYKISLTLSEAAAAAVYWNILANRTETIKDPPAIQVGELTKEVTDVNIANDYNYLEVQIYSSAIVPKWRLRIENYKPDMKVIKDDVDNLKVENGNMKNDILNICSEIGYTPRVEFTNYAIDGSSGALYPSDKRLISSFVVGKRIGIYVENAKYVVAAYNDSGFISESGWKYESGSYSIEGATKYRLVISKKDDSNILPSEVDSLGLSIDLSENSSVLLIKEQSLADKEKKICRANLDVLSADEVKEVAKNEIEIQSYPSVEDFYKNAWVRYSDGYISGSSGGAKLYILKRKDLGESVTKLFVKTNTESSQFASVAFYSNDNPSADTYLKDISVQGINDKANSYEYEINLNSDGWETAIVLHMSQYNTEFYIKTNSKYVKLTEKDIEDLKNAAAAEASILFNPFARKPVYHHLNQEPLGASTGYNHNYIPAQSLYDIAFAKSLGFDMIEANVHACSDGVFITKHGSGGTFGKGLIADDGIDYQNIPINSISSDYVRQHIKYDSVLNKYKSPIPTLGEFAKECKRYGMSIKADYKDGALEVIRQYLTDDNIFFTGLTDRGDFKGLLEVIWNNDDMESFDTFCKKIGPPLQIVIQAGLFNSLEDNVVKNLTTYAHENGYTVSVAYVSTNDWIRAKSLGVDANISTKRTINSFEVGNDVNIYSLSDNKIQLEGCSYDSSERVINMPSGSSFYIPSSSLIEMGKCSVDISFSGKLTVVIGQDYQEFNLSGYESDGNSVVNIANAIMTLGGTYDRWVTVKADSDTIVKSINVRASFIPL